MNGDQLKIKMLGVGRKPPFVLNDILLSVLPTGSLDNCNPKFGLAPGQMTRFNNSPDDLNSKPVSSQYQRLWRFCDSAGTLAPTTCVVSRSRTREDFPQQPQRAPSVVHLRPTRHTKKKTPIKD